MIGMMGGYAGSMQLARVGHALLYTCTPSLVYIHSHPGSHALSQTPMPCPVSLLQQCMRIATIVRITHTAVPIPERHVLEKSIHVTFKHK
jgi:hypothetical protein